MLEIMAVAFLIGGIGNLVYSKFKAKKQKTDHVEFSGITEEKISREVGLKDKTLLANCKFVWEQAQIQGRTRSHKDKSVFSHQNFDQEKKSKFVEMPKVEYPQKRASTTVRILPSKNYDSKFYQAARLHCMNGKIVHCRKTDSSDKTLCPVCEHHKYLWDRAEILPYEQSGELQRKARFIKPVDRFYYNAIVREPRGNSAVKILSVGETIHKKIIKGYIEGFRAFDTEEGHDFHIIKEKNQTPFPDYESSSFDRESSPVGAYEGEPYDLTEFKKHPTMEELENEVKKFAGFSCGQKMPTHDWTLTPKKEICTCDLPHGHEGEHRTQLPNGKTIHWDFDDCSTIDCDCEENPCQCFYYI